MHAQLHAVARIPEPFPAAASRSPRVLPSEVVAFVGVTSIPSVSSRSCSNLRGTRYDALHSRWAERDLRLPEAWTTQQLEDLEARGLLRRARLDGSGPTFWYEPHDPELERTITQVADCFRRHKTRVVALILSSDVEDPLRSFSDAFRIRKDR
ncbi:MAG: hypothetical protein M3N47_00250 [Chloroflexota bacterium]|nr:hypothetical protein [Chloroflexota bacterium]